MTHASLPGMEASRTPRDLNGAPNVLGELDIRTWLVPIPEKRQPVIGCHHAAAVGQLPQDVDPDLLWQEQRQRSEHDAADEDDGIPRNLSARGQSSIPHPLAVLGTRAQVTLDVKRGF